jgi:hypothetical protein
MEITDFHKTTLMAGKCVATENNLKWLNAGNVESGYPPTD